MLGANLLHAFRLTKGRWFTVGNPDGYAKAMQAAVRAEQIEDSGQGRDAADRRP
jgi:hypothetical protein